MKRIEILLVAMSLTCMIAGGLAADSVVPRQGDYIGRWYKGTEESAGHWVFASNSVPPARLAIPMKGAHTICSPWADLKNADGTTTYTKTCLPF